MDIIMKLKNEDLYDSAKNIVSDLWTEITEFGNLFGLTLIFMDIYIGSQRIEQKIKNVSQFMKMTAILSIWSQKYVRELLIFYNMKIQFNQDEFTLNKRVQLADIQQIQTQLGLMPLTSNVISFFYYNFPNILQLIQLILSQQKLLPKNNVISQSNIMRIDKISSLKGKYELNVIIYAVLLAVFKVNLEIPTSHERQIQLRRNMFLHNQLNSLVIGLQILIEQLFRVKYASFKQLNTFFKIKISIMQNLNAVVKTNSKQKVILSYSQKSTAIEYRRQLIIDNITNLLPDFFEIKYSNISQKNAMSQLLEEIINFFARKQIAKSQIVAIIEQILLTLGIIAFYQTIKSNPYISSQESSKQIATISEYNIMIQIKQLDKNSINIYLTLTFSPKNCQRVGQTIFMNQQIILKQFLSSKGYSGKYISINNLVYQINTQQTLNKSDFHNIYRAQSLELDSITTNKNYHKKTLSFLRKNVIIKRVERDKIKKMIIPEADEVIILKLIKEIKHKQKIKTLKRKLNFLTSRDLIGINKLINVFEIFMVQNEIQGQKEIQAQYFVFQQCRQDLMKLRINQHLAKISAENQAAIIFNIFKQITEGLVCLHFDIEQLYPMELNHYLNLKILSKTKTEDKLNIYYGNIKPSNIGINYLNDINFSAVVMSNFSKSKICKNNEKDYGIDCHSLYNMAPETKNARFNNEKIDIWGLGIMLLQIINQGRILERESLNQKQLPVKLKEIQLLSKFNQKWFQLLNQLLQYNPKDRPNSKQVLNYITYNQFYLVHRNQLIFKKIFKGNYCYQIEQKDINSSNQDRLSDLQITKQKYSEKLWPKTSFIRIFTLSTLLSSTFSEKQKDLIMVWIVLGLIQLNAKANQKISKRNLSMLELANVILLISTQKSNLIIIGNIQSNCNQSEKRRLVSTLQSHITLFQNSVQYVYQTSNLIITFGKQLSSSLYLLVKDKPLYRYNNSIPYFYGYVLSSVKGYSCHFKPKLFYQCLLQDSYCYRKAEGKNIILFQKCKFHDIGIVSYKLENTGEKIDKLIGELVQILKDCKDLQLSFTFCEEDNKTTNLKFVPLAKIRELQDQYAVSINLQAIKLAFDILKRQSYALTTQFQNNLIQYIHFQLQESNYPNFQQIYKLSALIKSGNIGLYQQTISKIKKYSIDPKLTFCQLQSMIGQLFIINNKKYGAIIKKSLSNMADNLLSFTYLLCKLVNHIFKVKINMSFEIQFQDHTPNEYLPLILKQIKQSCCLLNKIPIKAEDKETVKHFGDIVKDLMPNLQVLMYTKFDAKF